ncbi:4'-phosphopantetheinyl transferase family protein [Myceligenerans indicum]|uniref:4'-phosphopantetheinyl transferase superfamily protein n=1 Tax=Myceligenerans indicum TaxID=2593663 RepID=A0ABS1LN33_9MICO|nr:4'-phosphopantetheinyl transferase superfamily protein [Myceligenerans indicum]MBL0887458.1 4'-phosphopantetheinyl transferase superfamily protein [Myceligenerans indicum]
MDLTRTHVLVADGPAMRRLAAEPPRSPDDRARLHGMRSAAARLRFCAGRALVTRLLGLAGAPTATRIVPDERGRPRLDPPVGLAVSISHTRTWAAAAVVAGDRCGVDVEERLDPERFTQAALRSFLPEGWAGRLAGRPDPAEELTRSWVLLEAALKWRGTGFSAPLDELRFRRTGDGAHVAERLGGRATRVEARSLAGGAMLAVSTAPHAARPRVTFVDGPAGPAADGTSPAHQTPRVPLTSTTKG